MKTFFKKTAWFTKGRLVSLCFVLVGLFATYSCDKPKPPIPFNISVWEYRLFLPDTSTLIVALTIDSLQSEVYVNVNTTPQSLSDIVRHRILFEDGDRGIVRGDTIFLSEPIHFKYFYRIMLSPDSMKLEFMGVLNGMFIGTYLFNRKTD